MKRVLTMIGTAVVLVLGVTAAVAVASGGGSRDRSTSTSTTVKPVVGAATTTTATTKVWLCHHTGSWKHPYHLIHVSSNAVAAHRRHGDVDPGAGNSCPTTQPAGAKAHGKSGDAHGNSGQAREKSKPGSKDEAGDKDGTADD
jgi:hypothetical protein